MNNNSNNICTRAASSGLMMLQQYRWIYWWLNNINLLFSKSYLEQQRKYATAKWRFYTTIIYYNRWIVMKWNEH